LAKAETHVTVPYVPYNYIFGVHPLTTNDGFSILSSEETSTVGFRKSRGEYRKRETLQFDFTNGHTDGFGILDLVQTEDEFRIVTPAEYDSIPTPYKTTRHERAFKASLTKPVIFIDGEGANHGEAISTLRSNGLVRKIQNQNYALHAATLEPAACKMDCWECESYQSIIGENNHEQLSSVQCLDFIVGLPITHIIVGYGLSYDVEHWLKDVPPDKMLKLKQDGKVWWKRYLIHYIPNKVFNVSKWSQKRKEKKSERISGASVYDIVGFFQSTFVEASEKWKIGTKEEREYIEKMKALRPGFQDISQETLTYNHMEGKHGIQLFRRVREEYTKLELRVQRPVGAGSIASAMFRRHRVDNYFPIFQSLPVEVMLSGYIGGRFDVSRIGFVGDIYEYDINSAYPHIARTLPCLAHTTFRWTDRYVPDSHSLWLVRWRDNENPWAPFPYRTANGNHIRYYSSGTGYYYGSEVTAAFQFDPDIDIVGGYECICECDERPFQWVEDYYAYRQVLKSNGDFAEIIIKLGLNSVYGKLAQSKGKSPPWQNFIWAGMITSGTRAMLMQAVMQNPRAVIKLSTDAVFSTEKLNLPEGKELGEWKRVDLENLLILGNGIYHSPTVDEDGNSLASKNRGYLHDAKYFNWQTIRENFKNKTASIVTKHEFMKFSGSHHAKKLEERCTWLDEQQYLAYDPPSTKILRDGWIWPGINETPLVPSAAMKIQDKNLRKFGSGE